MTTKTDVLVIGGGIAGIGLAARLAGEAKVFVLEREAVIGFHSTGRSAAIFVRNYGNATLRALNAASEGFFEQPEGFSDTPLLSPRGELMIAGDAQSDALADFVSGAVGVETLTPDEAVSLVPILRRDQIAAAAIEGNARDIDVDALLQAYARRVRSQSGCGIRTGAEVLGIARKGAAWHVETSSGGFEAPVLVNAGGAWADIVAGMAGVAQIGLVPMRRSAAILPPPSDHQIDGWPMVGSFDESWYMKPQSGKLMVSPSDEDPVEPHDAWPDDMVLAEGLDRFERATTYTVSRVERSWAGLRSFVTDRSPVAGFAPDAEGFFWLAGQGGYGIQTSPALSQFAADLILKRVPTLAPEFVAALSPGRSGIGPDATMR